MLYKLGSSDGKFDKLEPVQFKDFSSFGKQEKELEDMIANNLLENLYKLMPIFQERQGQPEADIFALNKMGELIIFELKRGSASENAVHQILRYAQEAGQWRYPELQKRYQQYPGTKRELTEAHKEAFELEEPLDPKEFNNKQHLIVIGSAADDRLMNAVDYWKKQGVSIDFSPYRIYESGHEKYFEFFALPYDKHMNPGDAKGVLFDTNRSYDENAIWYMMENNRVAAFGDAKCFVEYIYPGDIVFFSHTGTGLVAAAEVKKGGVKASSEDDALYREVEFRTPVPERDETINAMPFGTVSEITGESFYWARTIKVPYLSKGKADKLVVELDNLLKKST